VRRGRLISPPRKESKLSGSARDNDAQQNAFSRRPDPRIRKRPRRGADVSRTGRDRESDARAQGGQVLLYPGGAYMRVVPPLEEPGSPVGPIHLHMPVHHRHIAKVVHPETTIATATPNADGSVDIKLPPPNDTPPRPLRRMRRPQHRPRRRLRPVTSIRSRSRQRRRRQRRLRRLQPKPPAICR
jgi:hypothetical protein